MDNKLKINKWIIKCVLLIAIISISFNSFSQWQSWEDADWSFNRLDHQLHYFIPLTTTLVVSGFVTYIDLDNPNLKRGMLYGSLIGGGMAIGKELIWDYTLGFGTPTYPDLFYGIGGTLVGLTTSYLMTKFHIWHKNKKNIKLEEAL